MMALEIKNLIVSVEGKEILHNVSLSVNAGEVVALMGPNGSGKSTLAYALMGHPKYEIMSGDFFIDGKSIKSMPVNERSKHGLFLSFQYPCEIHGVTVANFLRTAYMEKTQKKINVLDFYKMLYQHMDALHIERGFAKRYMNVGFSGGEKKKMEALQLMILQPKYAVLDETDSGLDIDALKIIAESINTSRSKDSASMGILVITHYTRILKYIKPDKVIVVKDGRVVASGTSELGHTLEEKGYAEIVQ